MVLSQVPNNAKSKINYRITEIIAALRGLAEWTRGSYRCSPTVDKYTG